MLGLGAAVVALVLAAGCGDGGGTGAATAELADGADGPAPPPGPVEVEVDPCTLLTDDEAARVLGATPQRSGPVQDRHGMRCQWDIADAFVAVTTWEGDEFYAGGDASPTASPLDIGDDGFRDGSVVVFIDGQTVIEVQLLGTDVDDAEPVARTVEGRLS